MSNRSSQPNEPGQQSIRQTPDADETLLLGNDETKPEFEDILVQARKHYAQALEPNRSSQALSQALRDIEYIRKLAKKVDSPDSARSHKRILGQFELLERVGQGGMGEVWKARHIKLGKIQAVKILANHRSKVSEAMARFAKEMAAIGKLQHPNIVAAHHADEVDGVSYLVMDFVDGVTLSDLTKQSREKNEPIPYEQACEIIRQASHGLHYSHEQGIVHRDIKPGNIMLDRDGNVRILDLGLARIAPSDDDPTTEVEITNEFQVLGTPDYMSPEQIRNSKAVDARSDIYSLGATLYYVLTGEPCFPSVANSSLMDKAMRILNDPAPNVRDVRDDVPSELAVIIDRSLSKSPSDRPQTALEFATELESWSAGSISTNSLSIDLQEEDSHQVTPQSDGHGNRRRNWLIAAGILFPLFILAGIIIKLALPGDGELIVELDDPNAKLSIIATRGKATRELTLKQSGDSTYVLSKGEWEIELSGIEADRFELSKDSISISSRDKEIVSVTAISPPPNDERNDLDDVQSASSDDSEGTPIVADNAPLELSPQDADMDSTGLALMPAKRSEHFQVSVHLRRAPYGIVDVWSQARCNFDVSNDGKLFAYSTGEAIHVEQIENQELAAIVPGGINDFWQLVRFSPDGSRIAVFNSTNKSRVMEIRDVSGRLQNRWSLDDLEQPLDFPPIIQVRWMPDGEHLLLWNYFGAAIFDTQAQAVARVDFVSADFHSSADWQETLAHNPRIMPLLSTASVNPITNEVVFVIGSGRLVRWQPEQEQLQEIIQFAHNYDDSPGIEWSADGDRLLAWTPKLEPNGSPVGLVLDAAGNRIAVQPRTNWQLATWAPDGRAIVTDRGEILDENLQTLKQLDLGTREQTDYPNARRIPYWSNSNEVLFGYADVNRDNHSGLLRRFRPTGSEIENVHRPQPLSVVAAIGLANGQSISVHPIDYDQAKLVAWSADGSSARELELGYVKASLNGYDVSMDKQSNRIAIDSLQGRAQNLIERPTQSDPSLKSMLPQGAAMNTLLSPNGKLLCYGSEGLPAFLVTDLNGQIIHRFEEETRCFPYAVWGPNSRWIAWRAEKENHQEVIKLADLGQVPTTPIELPRASSFSFSPDGKLLAATRSVEGKQKIVIRELDSGEEHESAISWNRADGASPAWSSDSRQVYAGTIFSIDEHGSPIQKIELENNERNLLVKFSPNGQLFVCMARFNGTIELNWFNAQGRLLKASRLNASLDGSGLRMDPYLESRLPVRIGRWNWKESFGTIDLDTQEIGWVGYAFDDGKTLAIGASGELIHSPRNIDPYLVYSIRYPGGRVVPVTSQQLARRLQRNDKEQAGQWLMDQGAGIKYRDLETSPLTYPAPTTPGTPYHVPTYKLTQIDLSDIQEISDSELDYLTEFSNLKTLDLSNTPIASIPFLESVEVLDLSGTKVNSEIGLELQKWSQLRELSLRNTEIDRFTLLDLDDISTLEKLDLRGTDLTEEDVNAIREQLPNCEVLWEPKANAEETP